MNKKTRTLTVNGRRTSVQLLPEEWEFIDTASEMRGTKWTKWASPLLERLPAGENMTSAIRLEALRVARDAALFGDTKRPIDLERMAQNKLTSQHGVFDDEGLADFLKTRITDGVSDFGGFTIHYGTDQHGRDFLVVENQLKGHPHFATVLDTPSDFQVRRRGKK